MCKFFFKKKKKRKEKPIGVIYDSKISNDSI